MLAEVGRPNVGLLLDTFHMNIEKRSIEESILNQGQGPDRERPPGRQQPLRAGLRPHQPSLPLSGP